MRDLPILNYHGIQAEAGEYRWTDEEKVYVISREDFVHQLDYVVDSGYQSLLPEDLDAWQAGKSTVTQPIMLTFDDGHLSHYEHAVPLLEERGLKAVFVVSAEWLDRPEYMTGDHLCRLRERGFVIGSHGCAHIPLPSLKNEALDHEIRGSREILERVTGSSVDSFSLPRGFYHRAAEGA